MPDDLLHFVSGPPGYSVWWLCLGIGLLVLVIAWYATIFVATLPSHRLRRLPVLRAWHGRLLRYRFSRAVAAITRRYRVGRLTRTEAGAAISATLRSFLHQATGQPAQYMQMRAVAAGDLAPAAPLLAALGDTQFDRTSTVDVGLLGERTEELIRAWG